MGQIKQQHNFHRVLWNSDDQVIVRELIEQLMPKSIQEEIVKRYNEHVERYNARIDACLKESPAPEET